MLSIILLIFKIIGIILLALLGLLITIILTILLVPIRYQIAVEHGENLFRMQGRVHWLLHVLHCKITHLEGTMHIKVRLFGYVIFDNLEPRSRKRKSKFKKASGKKTVRKETAGESKSEERVSAEKAVEKREVSKKKDDGRNTKEGNIDEIKTEEVKADETIADGFDADEIITDENRVDENSTDENRAGDSFSLFEKLRQRFSHVIEKIKNAKNKIIAFFKGLKAKLLSIADSVSNLKRIIGLISDFIKDEINREGFQVTFTSIKKLLKHILPKKIESRIVFGTGDPCTTGQILGVLGVFYGIYGDKVQIIPDFEHAGVEGKHYAKGRIRLGTLLVIAIKLLVDKRFKQLKGNFQILKEAL